MWRLFFINFGVTILVFPFVVFSIGVGVAQVMESSNYQIQSDSLNVGGGYSTSSSYVLESTVGEVATGNSTSSSFNLRAGYQQMQKAYLSLTGASAVMLSPSIPGVSGGVANGSTTVLVVTDNLAGYILTIDAESSPAMQSGGHTISDYVPVGSVPDFIFSTGVADAHLGFSPEGVDIVDRYRDNGGVCGVSTSDTSDRCWDGLSTTPIIIADSAFPNHPIGSTTTIKFRVGVGGSVAQPDGVYVATTTITALLQ